VLDYPHLLCVRCLSFGIYERNIVSTRMRHAIHKRTAMLRSKPHRNRNLVASLKRAVCSGKRQVEIDSYPTADERRRSRFVPIAMTKSENPTTRHTYRGVLKRWIATRGNLEPTARREGTTNGARPDTRKITSAVYYAFPCNGSIIRVFVADDRS